MNNEYRIKVVEKNNGDVEYIPQIGTPRLSKYGLQLHVFMQWKNLVVTLYDGEVETHSDRTMQFNQQQQALDVIEKHKHQIAIKNGREIKQTTYINIK